MEEANMGPRNGQETTSDNENICQHRCEMGSSNGTSGQRRQVEFKHSPPAKEKPEWLETKLETIKEEIKGEVTQAIISKLVSALNTVSAQVAKASQEKPCSIPEALDLGGVPLQSRSEPATTKKEAVVNRKIISGQCETQIEGACYKYSNCQACGDSSNLQKENHTFTKIKTLQPKGFQIGDKDIPPGLDLNERRKGTPAIEEMPSSSTQTVDILAHITPLENCNVSAGTKNVPDVSKSCSELCGIEEFSFSSSERSDDCVVIPYPRLAEHSHIELLESATKIDLNYINETDESDKPISSAANVNDVVVLTTAEKDEKSEAPVCKDATPPPACVKRSENTIDEINISSNIDYVQSTTTTVISVMAPQTCQNVILNPQLQIQIRAAIGSSLPMETPQAPAARARFQYCIRGLANTASLQQHHQPNTTVVVINERCSACIEHIAMMQLAEMGFPNISLNRLMLRKHKYDLTLAVEDLLEPPPQSPTFESNQSGRNNIYPYIVEFD